MVISGISGSVIAAMFYDAAKGVAKWLNTPFIKALQDTSVYFSKERGIEFRTDKLRKIIEGNISEEDIESFNVTEGLSNADDIALKFVSLGDFYLEDQSKILPVAVEILKYFSESLEKRLMEDPSASQKVQLHYIKKYGERTQATLSEIKETVKSSDHHERVDYSRDLLKGLKSEEALDYLERLKGEIWHSCEPIIKYRILTNIGVAKQMMDQFPEGARLSIEALQYNPDNENAIINAASGFLVLGQTDKANELAQKALEKNPVSERAFSIYINTTYDSLPFEDVEIIAPQPERTPIAYAIGHVAQRRKLYGVSIKWLKIAIENDEHKEPDIVACLAVSLMLSGLPDGRFTYAEVYEEKKRAALNESLRYFREAWGRVSNTSISKYKTLWLYNMSIIKALLGDNEGAIEDAGEALRIIPNNPDYIRHNAILLHSTQRNKDAMKVLNTIEDITDFPDMIILKSEILKEANQHNEAIKTLKAFLEEIKDSDFREKAQFLLIDIYLDINDITNAEALSYRMRQEKTDSILYLVDAAHIAHKKGDIEEAKALLSEAYKYWNKSTPERESVSLGNGLLAVKQYDTAARIYETVVKTAYRSPHTKKLLDCYYQGGDLKNAYELCKKLRETQGMIDFAVKTEVAILHETDNLQEASDRCEEFIEKNPFDETIALHHATVNLRLKNFEKVDTFLATPIDITKLSQHNLSILAALYAERGDKKKALETMYYLRRKNPRDENIHVQYIFFILGLSKEDNTLLSASEVVADTVVFTEDDSGNKDFYIIDNQNDAEFNMKEFNSNDPAVVKLLGHKVGDKIVVYENKYSKETITITEIKSKYLHALHESMGKIGKVIPESPYFKRVHLPGANNQDEFRKSFQPLLDGISRQEEAGQKAESYYLDGRITIGGFATLNDRNILEAWSHLINKPDIGIRACDGNYGERNRASSLLNTSVKKVIIDIISLATIHELGVALCIKKVFTTVGITQSTVDFIGAETKKRKTYLANGYLSVWKKGDDFISYKTTPEDIKKSIEYFESILKWIEDNCEIIPVKAAIEIRRDEKDKLNKLLGEESIDAILISKDNDMILLSDDKMLRTIAKNEYGVDGIWTQVFLMYCKDNNIISNDEYNNYIITLTRMNYKHTSIDESTLMNAARQSEWMHVTPFKETVAILGGMHSDLDSGAIVAINFISEIWNQDLSDIRRDALIDTVISAFTKNRSVIPSINHFTALMKKRFAITPVQRDCILMMIEAWKIAHFV